MSYKDKVQALMESLPKDKILPGRLHTVRIEHDSWCSIYSGSGECNCDPNVIFEGEKTEEEFVQTMTSSVNHMRASHEQRKKIGRNQPCPCGSGIKFKRCHGMTSQDFAA